MELPIAVLLWVSGTSWCLWKWISRAYTVCQMPKSSAYGFGVVLDLVGAHAGADAANLAASACVPFQLTFGTLAWLYDQIPTAPPNASATASANGSAPTSPMPNYGLVATSRETRSPAALSTYIHTIEWYTINDCVKLLEKQWATMAAKLDWVAETSPEAVAAVKEYGWIALVLAASAVSLYRWRQLGHGLHALSLLLAGTGFVGQRWYTHTKLTTHDLATLFLLLILVDRIFTLVHRGGRDELAARLAHVEDTARVLESQVTDLRLAVIQLRGELQAAHARADLVNAHWHVPTGGPSGCEPASVGDCEGVTPRSESTTPRPPGAASGKPKPRNGRPGSRSREKEAALANTPPLLPAASLSGSSGSASTESVSAGSEDDGADGGGGRRKTTRTRIPRIAKDRGVEKHRAAQRSPRPHPHRTEVAEGGVQSSANE